MTEYSQPSVRGYDLLAPYYRLLEHFLFGRTLQAARVAMLRHIPEVDRALFLGDGDGRLLRQFVLSQRACRITSVDQSKRMLQRQSNRLDQVNSQSVTRFVPCNALSFRPDPESYDLLVAVFFLDCFRESQVIEMLPRWLRGVRPGGLFYFVDFSRPPKGWRRFRADCYLASMHWFFRLFTELENRSLLDFDAILGRQPISLISAESRSHGLISARLYRVDGGCSLR